MLILAATLPRTLMGQVADYSNQYVSPSGSNSNNGQSWSNAKATLAGALTSGTNPCPSSGSCVIHVSSGGITLSATFTLNRAQTTIECEPGAVITTTVPLGSGVPFVVAANDTRITGCAFSYSSGSEAALEVDNTVSRVTIDHNLFENYPGGTGANNTVIIGDRNNTTSAKAVTDVAVTDNVFTLEAPR
jgi:hypothetical protein